MMNVGIIGFGKMGKTRAEAIKSNGKAHVVAVHDIDNRCNFEGYSSVDSPEDIFTDNTIDAIFICTANKYNKPYTIAGLEAGKHVFCEKPPALNAREIEEVREVEQRIGCKLMYGFNHRHHASIINMKNIINSGKFGKVLWMRGRYGKSVDMNFYNDWRAKKDLAGGGIMMDQGIHMLDLFIHLHGPFDDVHAFISNLYWKLDVEDNVFAIFRNTSTGVVASLHSTMTQWRHLFSLEVFLEEGYMVLNGLKTSTEAYGDEVLAIARNRSTAPAAAWKDEEKITYNINRSFQDEIDHFITAISEDSEIKTGNSEDALTLMQMMDKIYEQKH